ncbi:hypothetical protein [Halorubrum tropicale]|uniref:hypothetical protein n=1 Tax=Halorubrum tropicale TaxID=1765655 RepID=UPI001F0B3FA5|nr:hypothetical protein [Halorubrum tropicale]
MEDREILQIFLDSEDPVLFTGEVADEIGFSNQGTLPRLHALADRDLLESKDGGRTIVWWITNDGREFIKNSAEE